MTRRKSGARNGWSWKQHIVPSETVTVAGDDGDSDDDDSYTITTTTIITTIRWQNGTIEKELLQDDK